MLKNYLRSRAERKNAFHYLKKLSLLTEAGLSISTALSTAADRSEFCAIAETVSSGASFSSSLDPEIFPRSAINMISIGERNGDLSGGILRACQYMEKKESLRKKVIGSLIYPAFVMILCAAALFILMSILLPSFAGIYGSLGVKPPPLNALIMDLGRYSPFAAAISMIFVYYAARYMISDRGLNLPMIGKFRSKMISASYFRAMSQSLTSGMNIVESMELSISVIDSGIYKEKLTAAKSSIIEGNSICASLNKTDLFEGTAISLISAGEMSSSIGKVFGQLAALYEEEVENDLKTISGMVEPISTLATGIVVGIIVFAMFMPIIKLISVLGG